MLVGIVGDAVVNLSDPNTKYVIGGVLFILWTVFVWAFPKPENLLESRLWRSLSLRRVGSPRILVWVFGVLLFGAFGYYVILKVQPTLRVCEGQFEGPCSPHDVFVGCYGLPQMEKRCWHYKYLSGEGSRSGNMCGYIIHRVRCGDSFF
jgi:hypothetical protein